MKKKTSDANWKCTRCKEKHKYYAKNLCLRCYAIIYRRKYQEMYPEKVKESKENYYARCKEKRIRCNRRIVNALRRHGYTDKRITSFFGLKLK